MKNTIIKAWGPNRKDAYYKVLRTVGNIDLAVMDIKTKKEIYISRYQIIKELQKTSIDAFHSDKPWTGKDDKKRNVLIQQLMQCEELNNDRP